MSYEQGVSVVIPTYNSSGCIEKAIDSVISFSNGLLFEVICVDDKSDDVLQLEEILKKYNFASLITKQEKSNAADSRNIGIKKSQYRWIFLLDSDDTLINDTVNRRIETHENQQCGLIFGNYITVSSGNSIVSNFNWKEECIRDFILLNGGDFRTSTISIDKQYFKQTMFDAHSFKHQDWIFGIKCFDNNEKMIFDHFPLAIINVDGEGRMSSKINLSASRYLVAHYLDEQKHKNGFSKKNWKNVIAANNSEARKYFFSLFEPFSTKEKYRYQFYKIASSSLFMPVCSRLLTMLRKIKWQLAKFRH